MSCSEVLDCHRVVVFRFELDLRGHISVWLDTGCNFWVRFERDFSCMTVTLKSSTRNNCFSKDASCLLTDGHLLKFCFEIYIFFVWNLIYLNRRCIDCFQGLVEFLPRCGRSLRNKIYIHVTKFLLWPRRTETISLWAIRWWMCFGSVIIQPGFVEISFSEGFEAYIFIFAGGCSPTESFLRRSS